MIYGKLKRYSFYTVVNGKEIEGHVNAECKWQAWQNICLTYGVEKAIIV